MTYANAPPTQLHGQLPVSAIGVQGPFCKVDRPSIVVAIVSSIGLVVSTLLHAQRFLHSSNHTSCVASFCIAAQQYNSAKSALGQYGSGPG